MVLLPLSKVDGSLPYRTMKTPICPFAFLPTDCGSVVSSFSGVWGAVLAEN